MPNEPLPPITSNLIGDGYPVLLDPRTANLGGSFYFDPLRPYSPLPLKWCYEQLFRYPQAVLIDVGASTGCYSLLSKHHPDLTVYAFEPVPLTHEVLKENVRLNGLEHKIHVYPFGVADYNGIGIVHVVIADGGKGVSIVNGKPAYHKAFTNERVRVVNLDHFCERNNVVPTFIKIDCEGSEELVLRGAENIIQKYHPFLLFEYSQENADQFGLVMSNTIQLIEEWGYTWSNPEGTDIWAVHIEWENINKGNLDKEQIE